MDRTNSMDGGLICLEATNTNQKQIVRRQRRPQAGDIGLRTQANGNDTSKSITTYTELSISSDALDADMESRENSIRTCLNLKAENAFCVLGILRMGAGLLLIIIMTPVKLGDYCAMVATINSWPSKMNYGWSAPGTI